MHTHEHVCLFLLYCSISGVSSLRSQHRTSSTVPLRRQSCPCCQVTFSTHLMIEHASVHTLCAHVCAHVCTRIHMQGHCSLTQSCALSAEDPRASTRAHTTIYESKHTYTRHTRHNTAPHHTAPHRTSRSHGSDYGMTWHGMALYGTVWHGVARCSTVWYRAEAAGQRICKLAKVLKLQTGTFLVNPQKFGCINLVCTTHLL